MPAEDRKWLEEALKSFTFNDADRLQDICKELKNKEGELSTDAKLDLLEELHELVELHNRNGLNLCLCGGY
jgi:hypothetical protein